MHHYVNFCGVYEEPNAIPLVHFLVLVKVLNEIEPEYAEFHWVLGPVQQALKSDYTILLDFVGYKVLSP